MGDPISCSQFRGRALVRVGLVVAAMLGAAVDAPAAPDGRVALGATGVAVVPPPGFREHDLLAGFQHDVTAADLFAVRFPLPVETVLEAVGDDGLELDGFSLPMRVERSRSVHFGGRAGGRAGELFVGVDESGDLPLRIWLGVVGGSARTAVIVARCPVIFVDVQGEALESAVLGAHWDTDEAEDRAAEKALDAGLDPAEARAMDKPRGRYGIRESSDLRVGFERGTMILLSDPQWKRRGYEPQARLFVQLLKGPAGLGDLERFALDRARHTNPVSELRDIESRSLEVGGQPAFEITARARYGDTRRPIVFYQMVVSSGRRCYVASGTVHVDGAERYLPQFEEVARTLAFEP